MYDDEVFEFDDIGGVAGPDGEGTALFGVITSFEDSSGILVYAGIPEELVEANTSYEFDWMSSWGVMLNAPPDTNYAWQVIAYIDNGAVSFGEVTTDWGGVVEGSLYGDLVMFQ